MASRSPSSASAPPEFGGYRLGVSALALSAVLAIAIGLLSLRVRAIFFSMITLAVATAAAVLASQLSEITGGEDGLSFQLPPALRPAFRLFSEPVFGTMINGRLLAYYLVFIVSLVVFLCCCGS